MLAPEPSLHLAIKAVTNLPPFEYVLMGVASLSVLPPIWREPQFFGSFSASRFFSPCYQKHRLLLPPTIDIEERCFRRRVTKMSEWILIGSLNTSGVAERPFKQCKRC